MRISKWVLVTFLLASCNNVEPISDSRTVGAQEEVLTPDNFSISVSNEIPEFNDKLKVERSKGCANPDGSPSLKAAANSAQETVSELGVWVVEEGADLSTAEYFPVGYLDDDGEAVTNKAVAYGMGSMEEGKLGLSILSQITKGIGSLIKKTLNNLAKGIKYTFRQPGKLIKKVFAGVLTCAKQEVLNRLIPSRDLVARFLGDSLFEKFLGADVAAFIAADQPLNASFSFNGKDIGLVISKAAQGNMRMTDSSLGKIAKDLMDAKDWTSFATKNSLEKSNADMIFAIKDAIKSGSCKKVSDVVKMSDKTGTWDAAEKNDYLKTRSVCALIDNGVSGINFENLVNLARQDFKKYQKEMINRLIRSQLYAALNAVVPQTWVIGFSSCLIGQFSLTGKSSVAMANVDFNAPLNTSLIPISGNMAGLADGDDKSGAAILTPDGYQNVSDITALFAEETLIKEPAASGAGCGGK